MTKDWTGNSTSVFKNLGATNHADEERAKLLTYLNERDKCICARFVDACWLDYNPGITDSVHGVGYYGEEVGTSSQEEECARFLAECREPVFCADVDEFIEKIKESVK